MIENKVNGKVYIGSALRIKGRWQEHRKRLNREDIHCNPYLLNAWKKYGEQNFEFYLLEETKEDERVERELYWVNYYNSLDRSFGYNMIKPGAAPVVTDEMRQKISNANKGRVRSKEFKEKISISMRGSKSNSVKLTEEQVREIYIRLRNGEKRNPLAREFNISNCTIGNIDKKVGWAWLTDTIDEEMKVKW